MEQGKNELQEQIRFDLPTLIYDVLSNWWAIFLGALAAAMLTFVIVNETYVPQYTTRTTFVVSSKDDFNASSNLSSANNMAQTFKIILKSNVMRKILMEELGTEISEEEIQAEVVGGTNLLLLTATADSPKEAIDLIHAIMENYTSISYYTAGDAVLDVLEESSIPMSPDNPLNVESTVKKVFLIAIAALCALFGFSSYMRDTVKQEEEIERKLDARSLGVIPYERKNKTLRDVISRKKRALLVNDPLAGFAFVENYKKLATKVDYQMGKEGRKVLVVTSVSENEGKSTVAANLAICLAEQSKKVLLIDGDFRRPSQFLIFDKNPEENQELGEVLKGNSGAELKFWESNVPGLGLLLGRNCYSSSTELVHSKKMKQLLNACKEQVDYIIIDSPPTGLMGDAEALAGYADAVLMTVRQNFVFSEDINDALDSFREHHSKVLGVVLNSARSFQHYGSSRYHDRYGKYGNYARNQES